VDPDSAQRAILLIDRHVVVLVHSEAVGDRADALFEGRPGVTIRHTGGGWRGVALALRELVPRPALVYLIDIGMSTSIAAVAARMLRCKVVLDTGDLAYELARSTGSRGRLGELVVRVGERAALGASHLVVVRGRAHAAYIDRPAAFAPDFAPASAGPVDGTPVRRELGLGDAFVVGLVGSLQRAPRLGVSYGWDLIEALPSTSPSVHALIVGDGPARTDLERRADALGVRRRVRFTGRVDPSVVSGYIAAMDAAISTQSNDPVGEVRTTGKLPLYLACGCPVIATDVGEARRLLGPIGWTLPYEGTVDRSYPGRLARRITEWASDPEGNRSRRQQAFALHEAAFDRETIRADVQRVVDQLLGAG
jgi:glycosyltransferase involved in cell wall biosynthesis